MIQFGTESATRITIKNQFMISLSSEHLIKILQSCNATYFLRKIHAKETLFFCAGIIVLDSVSRMKMIIIVHIFIWNSVKM